MKEKILALILALAMVLSFAAPLVFAEEGDKEPAVTEEKPAEEVKAPAEELDPKIQWVVDQKWVEGYGDGDLKLSSNITRAEFTKVLVAGLGMKDDAERSVGLGLPYKDMAGHWASGYVSVALGKGLIKGYPDGTFRPENSITNAEIITMLVRAVEAITPQEELTAIWPSTYVVKASVNGILNDIKFAEGQFNQPATRDNSFKMIYNAANNANLKAFGNNSVIKAIVLQNNRLRKDLKKDEVNVEFMKVLQESDYVAKTRADGGDIEGKQKAFVIDEKVGDVENILGKVVNLTIDKNGKVIEIAEAEGYVQKVEDVWGVSRDKINGYTVNFNERYAKDDERIYATYDNNKDYKYSDFYRDVDNGTLNPSFARITLSDTKNVLFIEAFDFNDVAPVKEVKGKDVYYWNDMRDGRVDRFAANGFVLTYDKKYGFKRGNEDSIKADDVVHTYGSYNNQDLIVRTDAKVEDELIKTVRDKNGEYAIIGKDKLEAEISTADYHKGVYTYEKKVYKSILSRKDLEPVVGEKAKFLLSIIDELQLVDSDVAEWGDIYAINSIRSAGGVRFMPSEGDNRDAYETFKTRYYIGGKSLNSALLENFDINDIVYSEIMANGETDKIRKEDVDVISKMSQLATEFGKDGYSNNMRSAKLSEKYLTIDGTSYRFNNTDTKVFEYVRNKKANVAGKLYKFSMKEAVKNNKKNANLKAFVLTEEDIFNNLDPKMDLYNFLSRDKVFRKGFARVVIFEDADRDKDDTVFRFGEVLELYNWTNEIKVAYSNESSYKNEKDEVVKTQIFKLDDGVKAPVVDSVIEMEIDEESLKKEIPLIVDVTEVIARKQATMRVVSGGGFENSIVVKGKKGDETYYFHGDTETFGPSRWMYAQIYQEKNDIGSKAIGGEYVTVVRYVKNPIGAAQDTSTITFINTEDNLIVVDNDQDYFIDANTKFYENGRKVGQGVSFLKTLSKGQLIEQIDRGDWTDINGKRYLDKITLVKPAVVDPKVTAFENAYKKVENLTSETVTLSNEADVTAAINAYNAMKEEDKADYNKEKDLLDALNAKIAELKAKQEEADKAAAKVVEDQIEALPATVQLTDEAAIKAARTAYDALTPAQKAFVKNVSKLEKAEADLDKLKNPAPEISATAKKDKKVFGIQSYKITLVGAVAKDVEKVEGFDASNNHIDIVFDAVYNATNETDNFLVKNASKPNAGDYIMIKIKGNDTLIKVVLE